ncbi:uncharacterized protein YdhG (YjbR/CyaY superfamily) [Propionicimonas paludicola]|uniref:Uncharacterized protein YdhG (YjbR/CyaY superfamily) n=1 Tax=Propionicimonas paludicola TaxID=185243 RepID=A0A2A9CRT5_9ACTN|nr:DUF1801 domain-containing protein [Propionicimonas paludicola]PFG16340.1 uncharacterized protein YdhG (YjbR/CyaY superfamily) [Propionicimonas paludicola]
MGALSELISGSPDEAAALLTRLTEAARQQLPDAIEGVSYAIPCLLHKGKPVIGFRVGAKDFSLYPFSSAVVSAAVQASPELQTTKGSIHFTLEHPLTEELIALIVERRVAEIESR